MLVMSHCTLFTTDKRIVVRYLIYCSSFVSECSVYSVAIMAAAKSDSSTLIVRLRSHTREHVTARCNRLKQDIDLLFAALRRSTKDDTRRSEIDMTHNGVIVAVENATRELVEDQLAQYSSLTREIKQRLAALNDIWMTPDTDDNADGVNEEFTPNETDENEADCEQGVSAPTK